MTPAVDPTNVKMYGFSVITNTGPLPPEEAAGGARGASPDLLSLLLVGSYEVTQAVFIALLVIFLVATWALVRRPCPNDWSSSWRPGGRW